MVQSTRVDVSATGLLNIVTLFLLKCGRGLGTGFTAATSAKPSAPGIAKWKTSGRSTELKRNWLIAISRISFCFQRWISNRSTLGAHLSAVVEPIWPAMLSLLLLTQKILTIYPWYALARRTRSLSFEQLPPGP